MIEKKTVLITGAATGIGAAIAKKFISNNYNVHICDSDESNLKTFLKNNQGATGSIVDISKYSNINILFNDFNLFSLSLQKFNIAFFCQIDDK